MMRQVKNRVRSVVPIGLRMRTAAWLSRQQWLPVRDHFAMGLVRDLVETDPKGFHKFLWANHFMGYARWYDSEEELFGQMQPSRIELSNDLVDVLRHLGSDPSRIDSILEVGCSQGYILRYLETRVFPQCKDIVGIDIDAQAIEKGQRYLERVGSTVRLLAADMEELDAVLGPKTFDVTIAAGVLSYLNETDATRVVSQMLQRTGKVLALAGLAYTEADNRTLARSVMSPSHEGQWIHNFEAMVAKSGGKVVQSRWEGARQYNFQTICFVFAVPA